MPQQIKTVEQLNASIEAGKTGFFIALGGGILRASYEIYRRGQKYVVDSYVCSSTMTVSERGLFDDRLTNIGKAMEAGCLYAEG